MDYCDLGTSLPAWGVRVEIEEFRPYRDPSASLPAWGVRVEIVNYEEKIPWDMVTPRMGSAG